MSRPTVVSKDGRILAVGNDNVLKVKNLTNEKSTTNRIPFTTQAEGSIQMIRISPDNTFIAWMTKQPIAVCVESLLEPKYNVRLDKDKADIGFQTIIWSPDSQFLLVVSKLSVYIDVINIKEKTEFKMSGAVLGSDRSNVCSFSHDGAYFASAERSHPAVINIYTTDNWNRVQVLKVRGISNIGGMIWCQDSMSVIVWESLTHYQLSLCTLDGRVENKTKKDLVTVCNIATAPNGRLVGVQSDDFKVTITDLLTWHEEAVFEQEAVLHNTEDISVLKESFLDQQGNSIFLQRQCIEVKDSFIDLVPTKPTPKTRRRKVKFSACSTYIASYEPQLGEAIWVWCLSKKDYLHSVIMLDEESSTVNKITWHPNKPQLIADIGVSKILVWELGKCIVITIKDITRTIFNSDLYLATLNAVQEEDKGRE